MIIPLSLVNVKKYEVIRFLLISYLCVRRYNRRKRAWLLKYSGARLFKRGSSLSIIIFDISDPHYVIVRRFFAYLAYVIFSPFLCDQAHLSVVPHTGTPMMSQYLIVWFALSQILENKSQLCSAECQFFNFAVFASFHFLSLWFASGQLCMERVNNSS